MKSFINEMNEMNVTGNMDGGAGQPKTPKFKGEIDPDELEDYFDDIEDLEDDEETNENDIDSLFKRYFYELSGESPVNEISYREYKKDTTVTNKRKLNTAINSVNGYLRNIELIIDQNIKLKDDKNLSHNNFWGTTKKNVSKINQRIARIQTKLMKLIS